MRSDDLLARLAVTLRGEIGPVVAEPFAQTQAFMAAVILERLGRQISLADTHARADRDELAVLVDDLGRSLGAAAPRRLGESLRAVASGQAGTLGALIEALYADRAELGSETFEASLRRVRQVLRNRLDRQLEYAS